MKLSLIKGWQDFWRMWSVRLNVLGAALLLYFQEAPDAAISIWSNLPSDIKTILPENFVQYFGYILIGAGVLARVIRQRKLNELQRKREINDVSLGSTPERESGVL